MAMAFENLQPHSEQIADWRAQRVTLVECVEKLRREHGVTTTVGTLSRFMKQQTPNARSHPTPGEGSRIDTTALFVELLGEVRGRGEEQRAALEHLAGQVRVLYEQVAGGRPAASKGGGFLPGLVTGFALALALVGAGVVLLKVIMRG